MLRPFAKSLAALSSLPILQTLSALAVVSIVALAACTTPESAPTEPKSAPPNILLLVAEDLGPRIGSFGDPIARTPNLDELAQRSTRYTQTFTTAGVCSPSRAALITGQHQISFGAQHMRAVTSPLGPYLAQPPAELRALPELLRQAGYYTFTDSKLDYQFSGVRAGSGPFTLWNQDGVDAAPWRARGDGQPFFGLINFMETHESGVMRATGTPWGARHKATQAFRASSGLVADTVTNPADVTLPPYYPELPAVRADIARHYDNIHAMDARVGRILAALKEDGLTESTVVIWTADHGDGLPRAKRELYDSGIHVPMLVHLPGQANRADDAQLISFVDLAPTLLKLAGVTPPDYLHGRNFIRSDQPPRQYIYAARDRIDRQRAIRDGRYKYIRSYAPEIAGGHALAYRDNLDMVRAWRAHDVAGATNQVQARWFQPAGREQLYDVVDDPHELYDLSKQPQYRARLQTMRTALDRFLARIGDTSEVPEATMRATFLADGQLPITPEPAADWNGDQVTLSSPIGASIGYRLADDEPWRLYRGPIRAETISAKSVRYGWQESPVVHIDQAAKP